LKFKNRLHLFTIRTVYGSIKINKGRNKCNDPGSMKKQLADLEMKNSTNYRNWYNVGVKKQDTHHRLS